MWSREYQRYRKTWWATYTLTELFVSGKWRHGGVGGAGEDTINTNKGWLEWAGLMWQWAIQITVQTFLWCTRKNLPWFRTQGSLHTSHESVDRKHAHAHLSWTEMPSNWGHLLFSVAPYSGMYGLKASMHSRLRQPYVIAIVDWHE